MVLFRNRSKIAESEDTLRNSMWPHAEEAMWHRKAYGGFVTVPKTMPFICRILDEISKNHPLGSTYQALWAFTWDNNAFVRLNRAKEVAYAAGFTGQRGERTLVDRLKRLSDAGFIEIKASGTNRFGFIFIPNPHAVIMRLWASQEAAKNDATLPRPSITLQEASYHAFLERALEIGCQDVKQMIAQQKEPASPSTDSDDSGAEYTGRVRRRRRPTAQSRADKDAESPQQPRQRKRLSR
jgi:hypothetical protein